MGETHRKRRRVFVEDTRGEGRHLRATWHAERRTFVVSTWIGDVCTGAVRLPAAEAPELVSLLVDGLAEMSPPAASSPPPAPAPPDSPAAAIRVLRRWLGSRVAGASLPGTVPPAPSLRTPPGPHGGAAPIPPEAAGTIDPPADEDRRSA